jgi:hypothetical protein
VSERPKYSEENWRRLIRGMIFAGLLYLLTALPGLYLIIKGRILLGAGVLLLAHAITLVFHRWSNRIPKLDSEHRLR